MRVIVERMRRDGIDVSLEELEAQNPGATIDAPILHGCWWRRGSRARFRDAFARFLSAGKQYYLPRTYIPMKDAVKVIRSCGGTAVLAHPLQYGYSEDELHTLVRFAAEAGMSGMEIYYAGYTAEQITRLPRWRRNLTCLPPAAVIFTAPISRISSWAEVIALLWCPQSACLT